MNILPGETGSGISHRTVFHSDLRLNHGWLPGGQWQINPQGQLILAAIVEFPGFSSRHVPQRAVVHPVADRLTRHHGRYIHFNPGALVSGHDSDGARIQVQSPGLAGFELDQCVAVVDLNPAPGRADFRPVVGIAHGRLVEFIDH